MLRIYLIDHHVLFREGLANLLEREPDFEVVGEAVSVHQGIDPIRRLLPDILLIDAELLDSDDFHSIRLLHARHPEIQMVILSQEDSRDRFMKAIKNGARGYITKNHSLTGLVQSIRAMQRGEAVIPRAMVGCLLDELARLTPVMEHEELSLLTPREIEVLRELGRGGSNQQIARSLEIAENTVKVHVHNILDKLNLPNRRQAARYARTKGIANLETSYRVLMFN